jgi:2'-5' RNA ligase
VRLFVAVEISADVQREAARVIAELKQRTMRFAPHAKVTWVNPGNLHITVRFIGHVDPDLGAMMTSALEPPFRQPAFELMIEGTGTFPPKRPPRVIWAGIAGGMASLKAIEQEVRSRLDPLVTGEDRGYHPHVTLGRVKHAAGLRPAVLLDGLEKTTFGSVPVRAVTLFESRLSSSGPTYVALRRTVLSHRS